MLLKNKIAVITGCNRGIGKKILDVFYENGATIFACARKLDNQFLNNIKNISRPNSNKIFPIQLDLESEESIGNAYKEITNNCEKIDILINNAGVILNSLFQMTTKENLKKIFEINYFNTTIFTQKLLKLIIKNKKGSIVYISSSSALDNNYGRNVYSSSKSAILSQSQTLSREVGRFNIRVNSIAPGLTNTDMMSKNTPENTKEKVISELSLNRVASPEEIANVALFLASDLSSYITGQTIRVDGGM